MKITLDFFETKIACECGVLRHLESVFKNRKPRFPEKYVGQLMNNHINAACSEYAFAKMFGLPYLFHVNRFHNGGDVECPSGAVEVRWTPNPDLGLKVRPDDTGTVVMLTGAIPEFEFLGFCTSSFAQGNEGWLKDFGGHGKPAYFVPVDSLMHPDEFVP